MSMKEFWNDDPDLFWAYRFSYYKKEKRRQEELNYKAWLQGAYIYEAVSVALANAFSSQKIDYSKEPYSNKKTEKIKEVNSVVTRLKDRVKEVQDMFNKSSTT